VAAERVLRTRRKSGEEIQVAVRSSLLRDATQTPNGIIACSNDITVQKRAEEALQDLAGRLLQAREEERRWIARELHDDVNQNLAALAMALSRIKQSIGSPEKDIRGQVVELQKQTLELSNDVRRLSHRLHPAIIEHVGLAVSLRSLCTEVSKNENLEIHVSLTDALGAVHPEVALTLYRVAQESLRNVAKHSRASQARVSLDKSEEGIHLSIFDDGLGFDVEDARNRKGLGILSMEERVRLFEGDFRIESNPGAGTRVEARIPLGGDTS
jgi:signal transduction histidine kinase